MKTNELIKILPKTKKDENRTSDAVFIDRQGSLCWSDLSCYIRLYTDLNTNKKILAPKRKIEKILKKTDNVFFTRHANCYSFDLFDSDSETTYKNLCGRDPDDFPFLPEIRTGKGTTVSVTKGDITDAIEYCSKAVCTDVNKEELRFFYHRNDRLCTTDSKRLHYADLPVKTSSQSVLEENVQYPLFNQKYLQSVKTFLKLTPRHIAIIYDTENKLTTISSPIGQMIFRTPKRKPPDYHALLDSMKFKDPVQIDIPSSLIKRIEKACLLWKIENSIMEFKKDTIEFTNPGGEKETASIIFKKGLKNRYSVPHIIDSMKYFSKNPEVYFQQETDSDMLRVFSPNKQFAAYLMPVKYK